MTHDRDRNPVHKPSHKDNFRTARDITRSDRDRSQALNRLHPREAAILVARDPSIPEFIRRRYRQ